VLPRHCLEGAWERAATAGMVEGKQEC